jgi:hypothetical protein
VLVLPKLNVLLFVVPAVVVAVVLVVLVVAVVVAFGEKLKLLFDSEEVLLLVKLNGLALPLLLLLFKALLNCCAGEVVGVLLKVKAFVLLLLLQKSLQFAVDKRSFAVHLISFVKS